MKVTFYKYTTKDDFLILLTPVIAFGKEYEAWSIVFAWLCFSINIEF